MASPGAILFDLDGTLLDTAPEFTYCLNILLQEEGRQLINVNQLRHAVSFGAKGMIELTFSLPSSHPEFEPLKNRFLALYEAHLGEQTYYFPGVLSVLTTLEECQIPWGIVTNKITRYTLPLLKKFKPLDSLTCVVTGDTLPVQKPHPAPLLHACQILNVAAQDCWFVGDANTDVQAARSAKMRCAIAHYGYIPPNEDPADWQADRYLLNAQDIAFL